MLDVELADDMGGIPDIKGIPDIDDGSGAMVDMDGIGAMIFAAFETLLLGVEPVIGSFMDIRGMEVIRFVRLSATETVEGLFIDIEGMKDIGFAGSTTLLCGIESVI